MRKIAKRILAGMLCIIFIAGLSWSAYSAMVTASGDNKAVDRGEWTQKDEQKDLGTAENPFTILEIVPNRSMAEIGYLIPGCEPIDMDALCASEDINTYQSAFANGTNQPAQISVQQTKGFADQIPDQAKISAWDNSDEILRPENYTLSDYANYGVWNQTSGSYSEVGYYQLVSAGEGNFVLHSPEQTQDQLKSDTYYFEAVASGGNYKWVEADNTEQTATDYTAKKVWTTRVETLYYTYNINVVTNKDTLIQSVFGTTSEHFTTQVITLTPEELTGDNLALIDTADMITIHVSHVSGLMDLWNKYNRTGEKLLEDAATNFQNAEISWNAVMEIVKRMASDHPAAMILDQAAMMQGSGASEDNFHKLYLMLMQYAPSVFYEYFGSQITTVTTADGGTTGSYQGQTAWDRMTFYTSLGADVMQMRYLPSGKTDVFGSIVAYCGDKTMVQQYVDEIIIERTYDEYGGNSDLFDYFDEKNGDGERPSKLSGNDATEYILKKIMTGTQQKSQLHILEVEPCDEYIYGSEGWQLYYRSLFPWFHGTGENGSINWGEDVVVTTEPSWKFIGDLDDLNGTYDLILFGAKQNASNGLAGYNDSSLNLGSWVNNVQKGLIYTSVGDLVVPQYGKPYQGTNEKFDANARYSGNDLTAHKLEELKSYLDGGKPIILASEYYKTVWNGSANVPSVDNSIVDVNSNFAKLAGLEETSYPTKLVRGAYKAATLEAALSSQECQITFYTEDGNTGCPLEYSYTENTSDGTIGTVTYNNQTDENGAAVLLYHFKVEGAAGSTYNTELYLDADGNGSYSDAEAVTDLVITEDETGQIVTTLEAGKWYQVKKVLSSKMTGILPWKLQVSRSDNPEMRDNKEGDTAVKKSGTKQTIQVLQMNLKKDMKKDASDAINFETDTQFQKYVGCLDEYKIQVTYEKNTQWNDKYGEGVKENGSKLTQEQRLTEWKAELDSYDVLLLGYEDMCSFTDDAVFYQGFQYFVSQGKGVILSHDMVKDASYKQNNASSATVYDEILRTLSGQRRKYLYGENWQYEKVMMAGKEVSLLPSSNLNKNFYQNYVNSSEDDIENGTASEFMDNGTKLYADYGNGKYDRVSTDGTSVSREGLTSYIAMVNQGQITNYPYQMPEVIQVAATHFQNYQLDLEQLEGSKVSVWYDLTDVASVKYRAAIDALGASVERTVNNGGIYSSRENDTRNNYYCYTTDNITYTGLGHTIDGKSEITEDEMKLFINTLVSAYQQSPENPKLVITNEDVLTSEEKNTLYVTFDEMMDQSSQQLAVTFQVEDEESPTLQRSYTLYLKDTQGAILTDPVYLQGATVPLQQTGQGGVMLELDKTYELRVPYTSVMNNGMMQYELVLESSYVNTQNDTVTCSSTTEVTVLPVGLFDLN